MPSNKGGRLLILEMTGKTRCSIHRIDNDMAALSDREASHGMTGGGCCQPEINQRSAEYLDKARRRNEMSRMQFVLSVSFVAGCLVLASCAATQPHAATAPTGIHEISDLYQKVTAQHRRQFRRTVQDHKAREMRLLAEKTENLLAATSDWDSDAHLTAANAADKNAARGKVQSFRSALKGLKDAADRADMDAVDSSYAAVMASYQDVSSLVAAAN
jgi:hypothetical protein